MPNNQRTENRSKGSLARLGDVVESLFVGMVIGRQPKIGLRMSHVRVASVKNMENGILGHRRSLQGLVLPESSQIDRFRLRVGDVLVSARGLMKIALVGSEH